MKVTILIPPYVLGEDGKGVMLNKALLPVGPLVVAGLLRERGYQLSVVDLVFTTEWREELGLERPDILLVSCHTMRNIPVCASVLADLKDVWGGLPYVVLGGNVCLELGWVDFARLGLRVDAVVRGFAHGSDVIAAIESRATGDIWPQKPDGNLPLPALDLLSEATHAKYLRASGGKYPLYGFGIGCHWSCEYCSAKMDSRFLLRSYELVAEEISLARTLGYEEIWCVDNLVFTHFEAVRSFDREVASLGMRWSGMTRAELVCRLPEGFLEGLIALREIAMGVEAISAHVLADQGRGGARYGTDLIEAFRRVNAAGIASNGFVILDLPGSSEEDFWELYDFLEKLAPSTISWSFYNPPARAVVEGRVAAVDMGFYRWPQCYSTVPPERVVQQAIILSGRFWLGWTPQKSFLEVSESPNEEFGVNFLEGQILQGASVRSHVGDLWEIWEEDDLGSAGKEDVSCVVPSVEGRPGSNPAS